MWTWTCLVWFLSKMTKLLSLFWRKLNVNSPDRFRFFDKNWTKHNRFTVGITYLRNKAQKIWRLWKMKLLSFDSFEFCAKMLKLKFELKTYRLVDTCEKQQQKLDVHNWCLIKLREFGSGYLIYLYFQTACTDQNILLTIFSYLSYQIPTVLSRIFFWQQNPPRFLSKV